ncbi:hypothetical protein SDJN03_03927, partial [Cucurbita argyrosperma subsp. sororia]
MIVIELDSQRVGISQILLLQAAQLLYRVKEGWRGGGARAWAAQRKRGARRARRKGERGAADTKGEGRKRREAKTPAESRNTERGQREARAQEELARGAGRTTSNNEGKGAGEMDEGATRGPAQPGTGTHGGGRTELGGRRGGRRRGQNGDI